MQRLHKRRQSKKRQPGNRGEGKQGAFNAFQTREDREA